MLTCLERFLTEAVQTAQKIVTSHLRILTSRLRVVASGLRLLRVIYESFTEKSIRGHS